MAALSAFARWRELAGVAAGWTPILGAGLAVGALAGTGQLGIGYGLGLLHYWLPAGPELTGGVWASQLTWVAWFAAGAVLAGAAAASRVAWRYDQPLDLGTRIAAAVAAAIGAAVVMPLTALPARSLDGPAGAEPADAVLAAGLGLVVGALAAVAVLSVRLVAVSVTLLVAAVWLLALVSAAPSLAPTADLPDVRLAVLDLPALGDARSMVAVLSPPALALLICGAVAAAARSRGFPPLLTAVSSAAAPGMLALTYLIGSPGTSDRAAQVSAYAGSLIALAAGLLVALLVGAVRLPSAGSASEAGGDDRPTGLLPPVSAEPAESDPIAESPSSEPWSPESLSSEPWPTEPPSTEPWSPSSEPPSEPWSPSKPPPSEPWSPSEPSSPEPWSPSEPSSPEPGSLEPEPFQWPAFAEQATPPEPAEPSEPSEPSEPPSRMSSLFPELRLPSATSRFSEPSPEPPEPAEAPEPLPEAGSGPAADVFWSTEPEPATEASDAAEEPAELAATSELPAVPPEPVRPSKRLRMPKLRRKPKPPKETAEPAAEAPAPEPAAPEPVEPTSPAAPEPAPAAAPPRRRRRGEVEHVDWISSLADKSEEEPPPEKGRRRLRRDRDLGTPEDAPPDVPTWRAGESPDTDRPPLHRPYVSGQDRSGSSDS